MDASAENSSSGTRYWNSDIPLKLRASVVFQGGGIRGLFFPGHLIGLRKKGIEKIFIYAGTSAGALVAIGIWAGLRPEKLHDFLKRKSQHRLGFALFSWGDLFKWALSWIAFLCLWVFQLLVLNPLRWLISLALPNFPIKIQITPGCEGKKLEDLVNALLIEGLEARGIHKELIEDVFPIDLKDFRPTFEDIWEITEWVRLVTSVRSPLDSDFAFVKAAYPPIEQKIKEINFSYLDKHGQLRNNILDLVYGKETAHDPFFAPIFLSTCCIDDQQPVVFNNIEKRYFRIPIAEIVRASAGHPAVFKPKTLEVDSSRKKYIDGGLMANFPAYQMNREVRGWLRAGMAATIPKDYLPMVRVPFATLGLSVVERSTRSSYLSLVYGILTGGARERLELELARITPYFRLVQQEVTGEPHYLSFFQVSPALIDRTYGRALQFVDDLDLSTTTVLDVSERDKILDNMEAMMRIVERTFPLRADGFIRGHFFLEAPYGIGHFEKKGMTSRGRPVTAFNDVNATVREFSGVVGLMRRSALPIFARLDMLHEKRRGSPNIPVLALRLAQLADVPQDLNFALVLPIFDFRTISYRTGELEIRAPDEAKDSVRMFDTGVTGAIIGAMLIDGILNDLTNDTDALVEEIVDSGILPTLERFTFEVGCILSDEISETLNGND